MLPAPSASLALSSAWSRMDRRRMEPRKAVVTKRSVSRVSDWLLDHHHDESFLTPFIRTMVDVEN
eukprot:scaffold28858_cov71-Cyclotella_meneghiniana.AAC.1